MEVVCVNNCLSQYCNPGELTFGKSYIVFENLKKDYVVLNDRGYKKKYVKVRFRTKKEIAQERLKDL
jgi:hypothetical protein